MTLHSYVLFRAPTANFVSQEPMLVLFKVGDSSKESFVQLNLKGLTLLMLIEGFIYYKNEVHGALFKFKIGPINCLQESKGWNL